MVDVAMVGAGQTKFGNHPLGLKGMWAEAIEKAVQSVDNGFDSTDVEEAFIGSIAFGGSQLETRLLYSQNIPAWKASAYVVLRTLVLRLVLLYETLGWPSRAVKPMLLLQVELRK